MRRSILFALALVCSMPACGSDDDDTGSGGTAGSAGSGGTAGSGGAAGTGGAGGSAGGGLKVCECCGTEVNWPADKDCALGACDGYCNFVDAGSD